MKSGTIRASRSGISSLLRVAGVVVALGPTAALAESFAVLTYNVRGLPPTVIEDRTAEIAAIAPLLEDFHTPAEPYPGIDSVVGLQELFYQDYYAVITNDATNSYPFITAKDSSGPAGIGDGLTMMSDFEITNFTRTQWNDCFGTGGDHGSDCDTNKGFTYSRVILAEGASVDVYTLHADAGQDEDSRAARRANITQLIDAINVNSPEGTAVIVLGDTNSLYTRVGNDNIQNLLTGTGLTDVWVQLLRGGFVPGEGPEINEDCATNPDSADCELVDKVFYRDGSKVVLAPQTYRVLDSTFSDEEGDDLSDHFPVSVVFDFAVVTTTTTTTSSTSTSTSTTLGERPCGDPQLLIAPTFAGGEEDFPERRKARQRAVVAGDALAVLKAAVGTFDCALCTCDVNNSGNVSATDALIVLKKAVGQDVPLNCPACEGV